MKTRTSFVANSSSSSFVITNTTDKTLTMRDFVEENKYLAEKFEEDYGPHIEKTTSEELVKSFEENLADYDMRFGPNESHVIRFGDEHGTIIGKVFDYMLRYVNKSKSFKVYMCECRGTEYDEKGKAVN